MSDISAIDTIYGEHRAGLARIERLRIPSKARRAATARAATSPKSASPRSRAIGMGLIVISALTSLGLLVAKIVP